MADPRMTDPRSTSARMSRPAVPPGGGSAAGGSGSAGGSRENTANGDDGGEVEHILPEVTPAERAAIKAGKKRAEPMPGPSTSTGAAPKKQKTVVIGRLTPTLPEVAALFRDQPVPVERESGKKRAFTGVNAPVDPQNKNSSAPKRARVAEEASGRPPRSPAPRPVAGSVPEVAQVVIQRPAVVYSAAEAQERARAAQQAQQAIIGQKRPASEDSSAAKRVRITEEPKENSNSANTRGVPDIPVAVMADIPPVENIGVTPPPEPAHDPRRLPPDRPRIVARTKEEEAPGAMAVLSSIYGPLPKELRGLSTKMDKAMMQTVRLYHTMKPFMVNNLLARKVPPVTHVITDYSFNYPFQLPLTCERVTLGHGYNSPLNLPPNVKAVEINPCFTHRISFPPGLKELKWMRNRPINLPLGLEEVEFGPDFSHPVVLTPNLKKVVFGDAFDHPVSLPSGLVEVKFGAAFNYPAPLPHSLLRVTFPRFYDQPVIIMPPKCLRLHYATGKPMNEHKDPPPKQLSKRERARLAAEEAARLRAVQAADIAAQAAAAAANGGIVPPEAGGGIPDAPPAANAAPPANVQAPPANNAPQAPAAPVNPAAAALLAMAAGAGH